LQVIIAIQVKLHLVLVLTHNFRPRTSDDKVFAEQTGCCAVVWSGFEMQRYRNMKDT
jgi:hypothetical protein